MQWFSSFFHSSDELIASDILTSGRNTATFNTADEQQKTLEWLSESIKLVLDIELYKNHSQQQLLRQLIFADLRIASRTSAFPLKFVPHYPLGITPEHENTDNLLAINAISSYIATTLQQHAPKLYSPRSGGAGLNVDQDGIEARTEEGRAGTYSPVLTV